MRILPHITDRDLERSQASIEQVQRADIELLHEYGDAFLEQVRSAEERFDVPFVIVCNAETEQVQPSPLDWDGRANVLELDAAIYGSARRALEGRDPDGEVVVLVYRPTHDVVSIYTLLPSRSQDGSVKGT